MNGAGKRTRASTPGRIGRRLGRCALGVSVVAAAVVAHAQVASADSTSGDYRVYLVESENFGRSNAVDFADKTATNGLATTIRRGGSIARTSTTPEGNRFIVRAEAKTCGTAPRMRLTVGSKIASTVAVSAKTWRDYTIDFAKSAGTSTLRVSFVDDKIAPSGCTRSLSVDTVTLRSAVPANQGIAGSVCEPSDLGMSYTKPPAPYSTTSLGSGSPGYYEFAPPSDRAASVAPKGLAILIHGGGWYATGRGAASRMRPDGEIWRAHGWATLSITSNRSCGHWVDDSLWFYDHARAKWPALPICLHGGSSGGHVALMVAAARADVHCVTSFGGPTDFVQMGYEHAYDPSNTNGQSVGPKWVQELATAAYGSDGLEDNSPLYKADTISCPVLLAIAAQDMLVPGRQATDMDRVLDSLHPATRHEAMILEPGTTQWVHAPVSERAYEAVWATVFEIAENPGTPSSNLMNTAGDSASLR